MDVSIIIPTYNVAPYIIECLESVASQTYQGVIECIVVDDCGTDESIPLAQEFIDSYNGNIKFRICHREKNGGLSAARNSGLFEAKGEFVYFLDSDDYITPNCIESLVEVAKHFPKVEIVQGGIVNTRVLLFMIPRGLKHHNCWKIERLFILNLYLENCL